MQATYYAYSLLRYKDGFAIIVELKIAMIIAIFIMHKNKNCLLTMTMTLKTILPNIKAVCSFYIIKLSTTKKRCNARLYVRRPNMEPKNTLETQPTYEII